jgi:hypothetical protein
VSIFSIMLETMMSTLTINNLDPPAMLEDSAGLKFSKNQYNIKNDKRGIRK